MGTLTFTRSYVADVPAAPVQATAYPNPFNPRTTIAWELPKAGQLQVNIHDVAGRRVRTLRAGQAEAGPGKVSWDGKERKRPHGPGGDVPGRHHLGEPFRKCEDHPGQIEAVRRSPRRRVD